MYIYTYTYETCFCIIIVLFSFNELENVLHCYLDKLYWHNPEVRLKGQFC